MKLKDPQESQEQAARADAGEAGVVEVIPWERAGLFGLFLF